MHRLRTSDAPGPDRWRPRRILIASTVVAGLMILAITGLAMRAGLDLTDLRARPPAPAQEPSTSAPGPDGNVGTPADDSTGAPGSAGVDPAQGPASVEQRAPWMIPSEGSLLHGRRYGMIDGFLVFRGNPTRTFYGEGPVPRDPRIAWSSPAERLCSIEGDLADGGRIWCGIGWTGQAVLLDRSDLGGGVEIMVGGYDGAFHFFDGATGVRSRSAFPTGAMVKGTESIDPDGYPLAVVGSRDGFLRIIALDRDRPTELWRLGRHPQGVWNDDWDANPTILEDVLYAAGEDGWFRMWRLNRGYDADGLVRVDPQLLIEVPGFDEQLFARLGDNNVSIESSPAITADRVYWANSGGRVMGIDRQAALSGRTVITFDFWAGDDVDASIVVDRDGMLVVAVEQERRLAEAEGLGQLLRLDPGMPDDPVLWRLDVPAAAGVPDADGGIWATPAVYADQIYVPTNSGELLVVGLRSGVVRWREQLGGPLWSSPAVIEDPDGSAWLILATCAQPSLRGYSLDDPRAPSLRWTLPLPGCVEATPVVWRGTIYVGTRDGRLHAAR